MKIQLEHVPLIFCKYQQGAIHKVRTLGRGRGGQAKSVQVCTRGEGG